MADSQLSYYIGGVKKTIDFRDILLKDSDLATYNIVDIEGNVHASLSAFFRTLMNDADAGAVFTTLGVSAFVQTMFDDANAAAVKTTLGVDLGGLGVSTFIQTLTDDTTAAAARDTLLIPNKNYTIDPNFEIWPEGTSITNTTGNDFYGSVLTGGNCGTGGSPSLTVSRQAFTLGQTDVPGEPKYFLRGDLTVAASVNQPYLYHKIESVRTNANGSITVTAYMKAGASINVDIDYVQNFGTTGSPSSDVTIASQSQALTTSWTKITKTFTVASISGKTLGTDDNDHLQLRIKYPLAATNIVDVSSLKQEEGIVSTDLGIVDFGNESFKSQRYYEKTYNLSVSPGTVVSILSGQATHQKYIGESYLLAEYYKVIKRSIPVVTIYNPVTGSSGYIRNDSGSTNETGTVVSSSVFSHFVNRTSGSPTTGHSFYYCWVADSRL